MVRTKIIKSSGIYKIQSIINNKIYIGSAVNFKTRKCLHFNELKKLVHGNRYLQRHFNKYGIDDLQFSIIRFCSKEELINQEQFYLDVLKPEFNICKIAGSTLGTKRTIKTKLKTTGRNNPMFGIHKFGKDAPNYGKHHSEEVKQRMSESHLANPISFWKGKQFSEETKQKMRDAHKDRVYYYKHSDKMKEKLSNMRIGKIASEDTKKKMSNSHKKISVIEIFFENYRKEKKSKICQGI